MKKKKRLVARKNARPRTVRFTQVQGRRKTEEMLFAGFGGQGIMFLGKLIAHAGLLAGKNITWMPSYGAEVRGGTAYSMTKISDGEIASPIVVNPDILVVMNKPSLIKYADKIRDGGVLIMNRSLIDGPYRRSGIKVINIPMTEMAHKLGSARCANMIAAGAIAKRSKVVSIRYTLAALKDMLKGKEDLFLLNKKAVEKGYGL